MFILSAKEKVNIEAKLASGGIPNSIWDTYSSFANTIGGTILLGVEEDKTTKELIPRGVTDPEQMISDIWNTLNNPQKISRNILLDNHVYMVDYNGAKIIVMEIPRAERTDKPIYVGTDLFKGSFRRNHEGDYHCTRDEVLAMLRDQTAESVDNKVLENLSLSDLNRESISVVSRVMRKFVLALVEICRMGAGYRPLVTFQQAGCKGSRAAVRRSSCP